MHQQGLRLSAFYVHFLLCFIPGLALSPPFNRFTATSDTFRRGCLQTIWSEQTWSRFLHKSFFFPPYMILFCSNPNQRKKKQEMVRNILTPVQERRDPTDTFNLQEVFFCLGLGELCGGLSHISSSTRAFGFTGSTKPADQVCWTQPLNQVRRIAKPDANTLRTRYHILPLPLPLSTSIYRAPRSMN